MDRDARIAELEREVAGVRRELAGVRRELAARDAALPRGDEDPAIARLLADRGLLSALPDVIMILDRDHRILYLNRVIPGRTIGEFLGTNVLSHLSEQERAARHAALERAWSTGEPQTVESHSVSGRVWDNRLVPIVEGGRVAYLLTTAVDLTERKRVEVALRESEHRLRHAIDVTGMGTWTAHWKERRVEWDDALCRIYGIDRASAPTVFEGFLARVHPDDRPALVAELERARARGRYEDLEHRIVRPDGTVRHLRVRGSVVRDEDGVGVGSYGAVFDVTDRKRLEEQLYQVQKMEAVGQLTAGIAHNFNNVLGVILPNVEICRRSAPPDLVPRLDDIAHAGQRGAEMVRQLMIFARRDAKTRKEPIDIAQCARRTVDICRTTFDRKISLELSIAPDLPSALGNAGQIEQVLLNVCLNARDALEKADTDTPHITLHVDRASSGAIRIRVRDNGPGMDEATRSRIFEPFFTTKDVNRGTGLGLASAYAIVADHRGRITCESHLGEGATFEIELPSTEQSPVRTVVPEPMPAKGGSETVLLVEDEPLVRGAVKGLLELGGYHVLEAADGAEGIATFERERGRIAAVIVDRSMPGLSGEQVLARLEELEPRVPVVMLSGNPGRADRIGRAAAVLSKPTSADTLLRTLRSVLEAASDR